MTRKRAPGPVCVANVNRTNFEMSGLHGPKSAFDQGQILVAIMDGFRMPLPPADLFLSRNNRPAPPLLLNIAGQLQR